MSTDRRDVTLTGTLSIGTRDPEPADQPGGQNSIRSPFDLMMRGLVLVAAVVTTVSAIVQTTRITYGPKGLEPENLDTEVLFTAVLWAAAIVILHIGTRDPKPRTQPGGGKGGGGTEGGG